MDDLLSEFLTETAESLDVIDTELVRFESEPNDTNTLNNIFRLVHTIKGTCGFLGLPRLEAVAHAGETLLGKFRDGALPVTPAAVTLVLESIDQIKALLAHLETEGVEPDGEDAELIGRLEAAAAGELVDDTSSEEADAADPELPENWDADLGRELRPGEVSLADLEAAFASTEVEEVEPGQTPDIETTPPAPVEAAAKPAAPATKQDTVEAVTESVAKAEAPIVNQTIRVNVDVLEDLMTMVSELVLTRNQLMQMVRNMDDSEFTTPLQRLSNITAELQDGVMKTRMQPIGNAWKKLPRIVRDACQDLNKKISLVLEGEQTELDRQVLELIKDPLTHMIRNSCDHGIELPSDRMAVEKPDTGTIRLRAFHEGGHIHIELSDDGAGLNTKRIRDKALEKGLFEPAELSAMTDQQIHRLIFHPGFSTAAKVTNISGRGVGMDVVKTNIELIGGAVDLVSKEGEGTVFTIKIPLTLAIISALIVGVEEQRFAIPQLSVVELVRTGPGCEHKVESINDTQVLRLRDRLLPLLPLSRSLGLETKDVETETGFVVVMQVADQRFGLVVDQVFDTEEIVVKPLANVLRHINEYSGSTILGDGSVIMILDPNGVARSAAALEGATRAVEASIAQQDAAEEAGEAVSLLVFSAGGDEPKACPLSLVTRLEELDASTFELTQRGPVVQYRGSLMPVVHAAGPHCVKTEGRQPVLVFNQGTQVIGLGVDKILDITHDHLDIAIADDTPGVLGTAVLKGKATEIIDIGYFLTLADQDWAESAADAKSEPKSVLLFESHPFFRNMLMPLLQSAGYKVTAVETAEAAWALRNQDKVFDIILADVDNDAEAKAFLERIETDAEWARSPRIGLTNHTNIVSGDFTSLVRKSDRHGLLAAIESASANYGAAA